MTDAIAIVTSVAQLGLLVATIIYAIITYGLVSLTRKLVIIEAERENQKRLGFLTTLYDEFRTNTILLDDFRQSLNNKSMTWRTLSNLFLGFRDDGWTKFRLEGGSQYLGDEELYVTIQDFYISQYKFHHKLHAEIVNALHREELGVPTVGSELAPYCEDLKGEIEEILNKNEPIQIELSSLIKRKARSDKEEVEEQKI